jgi:hypothetical protein
MAWVGQWTWPTGEARKRMGDRACISYDPCTSNRHSEWRGLDYGGDELHLAWFFLFHVFFVFLFLSWWDNNVSRGSSAKKITYVTIVQFTHDWNRWSKVTYLFVHTSHEYKVVLYVSHIYF